MLTAFALVSGVALAQSTGERLGINSALGLAPTTQDFVTEAVNSGQFEIQSSQLAQERGDQMSKTYAAKMIEDHQKLDSQLKDLVQSKQIKVTIPAGVSASQQSSLDKLKTLQGADFDRRYRDDQYSAHKDAVNLFERYAKGGENADLKTWAEQTTPQLQRHMKMAEDLGAHAQK
jgi:putative membrane protein